MRVRPDARVLVTEDLIVGTLLAIQDDAGDWMAYGLDDWRAECGASYGFDEGDLRRYQADGVRYYGDAIGYREGTAEDLATAGWVDEPGVLVEP